MYIDAYKMMMDAKHIVLVSHIDPDGDTLGSVLALYDTLKRAGKKVSLFNATKELPRIFDFLPNIQKIHNKLPKFYDLVVSCDCGSFDRLGIEKGSYRLINIDHHPSNEMFGDINLINQNSASAGKVIYDFLTKNSIKISKDCATCIYTTIVEDTGFFSYSHLDSSTFKCVADLINLGVDAKKVATLLKNRISLAKIRLINYVLNNFELFYNATIAFIYIDKDTLVRTGAKRSDTKNIANILRNIATVKVSIMLLEQKNGSYKVSLRSEDDIDILTISKLFNGGGHKNSAGFEVLDKDFEKLKIKILELLVNSTPLNS